MRQVIWADKDGFKHRSLVRDSDPDDAAAGGILQDPPDLSRLDWLGVQRDMHNAFIDHGIATWADLQRKQMLPGIITSAVKRRVIALFREKTEVEDGF